MADYGHSVLGPGESPPEGARELPRFLLEHLTEQVGFLDASCSAFDAGNSSEAKRLATTVRVLVHDAGSSVSLLHQLGVKDRMPWADGVVKPIFDELRGQQAAGRRYVGSLLTTVKLGAGWLGDHAKVRWVPVFEIEPLGTRLVAFNYWWDQPRIADLDGEEFSRRDITLALANKDGGAHIDPRLPSRIERIQRGSSMGVAISSLSGKTTRDDSPLPAAMRQIAEEALWSIRHSLHLHLHADQSLRSMGE